MIKGFNFVQSTYTVSFGVTTMNTWLNSPWTSCNCYWNGEEEKKLMIR